MTRAQIESLEVYYKLLPADLRGGMRRYVEDGIMPGQFLQACLANEFVEAAARADCRHMYFLQDVALFIFNELPADAWGSREKLTAWCAQRQIKRPD